MRGSVALLVQFRDQEIDVGLKNGFLVTQSLLGESMSKESTESSVVLFIRIDLACFRCLFSARGWMRRTMEGAPFCLGRYTLGSLPNQAFFFSDLWPGTIFQ